MTENKKTTKKTVAKKVTAKSNSAKASLDKKPEIKKSDKSAPVKATADKPASSKAEKPLDKTRDKPLGDTRDKFAVIKTGGKQYIVREGKVYDFEKLAAEEGKEVVFEEVLLVSEGNAAKIGEPIVAGAKVTGKVVSQFKDKKVMVLKYKAKKRYKRTYGHRQAKTKVEITKIA